MRVIEGSPEHRWNTRFDARRGVLDPRPARKKNRSKTGSTSRCPTSRTEGFWFTRRFVDSEPTCDARGVWRYGPGITYFASRGVRERPRRTPTSADGSVCGRTPGLLRLEESQRSLFTSESDGNDVREMLRVASADVAGYAKRGGMRGGSPFLSNNAAYSSSKKNFKRNRTCWALRCAECQYDGRAPRPFRFFVTRLRHTNQDFRTFPESRLNAFASQIHFCQLSPT